MGPKSAQSETQQESKQVAVHAAVPRTASALSGRGENDRPKERGGERRSERGALLVKGQTTEQWSQIDTDN